VIARPVEDGAIQNVAAHDCEAVLFDFVVIETFAALSFSSSF
jgi:hypothetical protein